MKKEDLRRIKITSSFEGKDEPLLDALFHAWGITTVDSINGDIAITVGIVEINGNIKLIKPTGIKFLD